MGCLCRALILEEAGGKVTDTKGLPLTAGRDAARQCDALSRRMACMRRC